LPGKPRLPVTGRTEAGASGSDAVPKPGLGNEEKGGLTMNRLNFLGKRMYAAAVLRLRAIIIRIAVI